MNKTIATSPLDRLKRSRRVLLEALGDAGVVIRPEDLGHCTCPWHDDEHGSFSVFEWDKIWFWRCHTCDIGGTVVDVLMQSENLETDAACREALDRYGHLIDAENVPPATSSAPMVPPAAAAPAYPISTNLESAVAILEQRTGCRFTGAYTYHGAKGHAVVVVLRLERKDGTGKTYRPLHWIGTGWAMGDPPGILPLYNLSAVLHDRGRPVVVVEGEKCADALMRQGILATTSAHGSKSASRTDWSPLAGRNVVVWPDNDAAGLAYRDAVLAILRGLEPPARARTVDPSTLSVRLSAGGDAFDFIEGFQP